MSIVYWDTMLFVYWFEDNPAYGERLQTIFSGMQRRGDTLVSSAFTVAEVLVGPQKQKNTELVHTLKQGMQGIARILPFTFDTAVRYSMIRANHRVSPADAIHLACAAEANVDVFLTNDDQLVGKVIPGIQFIAGMDISLY